MGGGVYRGSQGCNQISTISENQPICLFCAEKMLVLTKPCQQQNLKLVIQGCLSGYDSNPSTQLYF